METQLFTEISNHTISCYPKKEALKI